MNHHTRFDLVIIVPCYNEEKKLNLNSFEYFITSCTTNRICIIFVNDGSADGTSRLLFQIGKQFPDNVFLLHNPTNIGKANSIRKGVLYATQNFTYDYVGFIDADLSAPLQESLRLYTIALKRKIGIVFGSRVPLLGVNLKRSIVRHYFGRLSAVIISCYLGTKIYDTQCGAKIFHNRYASVLFNQKFVSRWLFDIEIFERATYQFGRDIVFEIPLEEWVEKKGSKIRLLDLVKLPIDFINIYYNRRQIIKSGKIRI